jgi:hypothetical protein
MRDPFKPRTTHELSRNCNACASYGCVVAGGDIGYAKKVLSHYVENAPVTQILCTWRSSRRIGFRQWGMVAETLNTDPALVSQIPNNNPAIVPT